MYSAVVAADLAHVQQLLIAVTLSHIISDAAGIFFSHYVERVSLVFPFLQQISSFSPKSDFPCFLIWLACLGETRQQQELNVQIAFIHRGDG